MALLHHRVWRHVASSNKKQLELHTAERENQHSRTTRVLRSSIVVCQAPRVWSLAALTGPPSQHLKHDGSLMTSYCTGGSRHAAAGC